MNSLPPAIWERAAENFVRELKGIQDSGKSVVVSSSFQTQSMPLLHMISTMPQVPRVAFLDTGFHFRDTLEFRDRVAEEFGLELLVLRARPELRAEVQSGVLFDTNPHLCCQINKVDPMMSLAKDFDVWITGVRKDQTANRAKLEHYEPWGESSVKWNPLLDWDANMVSSYIADFQLPTHPLGEKGYPSVGCAPCTSRVSEAAGRLVGVRIGRWSGSDQNECGLHLSASISMLNSAGALEGKSTRRIGPG